MFRTLPFLSILVISAAFISCSDDSGTCPQAPDARCAAVDFAVALDAAADAADDDATADAAVDQQLLDSAADAAADAATQDTSASGDAQPDAQQPDAAAPKEDCSDGKDNDGDGKADCLDPDCDGQICRVTIGYCDAEEKCANSVCPADSVKAKGTVCRKGDSCDIVEKCDGVSNHCPPDKLALKTLVCRAPSGPCDHAEKCDGISPKCPPDILESKGVVCRPAAGPCDVAEECGGTTDTCPADAIVQASAKTVCRAKAGPCDLEELCDGKASACPKDLFVTSSSATVCRPLTGNCDLAEKCDGKGAACPKDLGACSSTQYCNGSACVAKKVVGKTCKSSAECFSGHCYDGYCCDRDCSTTYWVKCRQCNKVGAEGTCTDITKGTFPYYPGAGIMPCSGYACDGVGGCLKTCASAAECRSHYYCGTAGYYKNKCASLKYGGSSCSADYQCFSGYCHIPSGATIGKCCNTSCSKCCGDCSSGSCKATKPANTDAAACGALYSCSSSGGLNASCTPDPFNCSAECSSGAWCWQGKCVADLDPGAACLGACQCKSNACFPFVCW